MNDSSRTQLFLKLAEKSENSRIFPSFNGHSLPFIHYHHPHRTRNKPAFKPSSTFQRTLKTEIVINCFALGSNLVIIQKKTRKPVKYASAVANEGVLRCLLRRRRIFNSQETTVCQHRSLWSGHCFQGDQISAPAGGRHRAAQ